MLMVVLECLLFELNEDFGSVHDSVPSIGEEHHHYIMLSRFCTLLQSCGSMSIGRYNSLVIDTICMFDFLPMCPLGSIEQSCKGVLLFGLL